MSPRPHKVCVDINVFDVLFRDSWKVNQSDFFAWVPNGLKKSCFVIAKQHVAVNDVAESVVLAVFKSGNKLRSTVQFMWLPLSEGSTYKVLLQLKLHAHTYEFLCFDAHAFNEWHRRVWLCIKILAETQRFDVKSGLQGRSLLQ
jgi:hypothetical protein